MDMLLHNFLNLLNVEGDTYENLKTLLEGIYIVNRPFQFVHIESRCNINYKIEGLNRVFFIRMYMLCH